MNGEEFEISLQQKYLWYWNNEDGSIASITTIINMRVEGHPRKSNDGKTTTQPMGPEPVLGRGVSTIYTLKNNV